jgi:hypothetical protein
MFLWLNLSIAVVGAHCSWIEKQGDVHVRFGFLYFLFRQLEAMGADNRTLPVLTQQLCQFSQAEMPGAFCLSLPIYK